MARQRPFGLVRLSELGPDESSSYDEAAEVGIVEVDGAAVRTADPRRRLPGWGARGHRERDVGKETGCPGCGLRSHVRREAMQGAAVAMDVDIDEAAPEQRECPSFLTRQQEVTERSLEVVRFEKERGRASMKILFADRIVGVESVSQHVPEQMVIPVHISPQLDEKEVPLVDTPQKLAGVGSAGNRDAALRVEHVEDRGREQEVEDLSGLAFEDLRSEEVGDGAGRVRERGEELIGNRFVAKGDGGHLDTGCPPLRAGPDELDLRLLQLDAELDEDRGDFGPGQAQLGVAHLEQLPARTKAMERELRLGPAADDHTTAGRESLDERGQRGCRSRSELEVVDHDHDRLTEGREVVPDRNRNVAEIGLRLTEHVRRIEPAVGPPASKRGDQCGPEGDGIGIALVA